MGRDAEERGEKRRERRVEMNSNGLNEHWTASEARKNREIAIRKDEWDKLLDNLEKVLWEYENVRFVYLSKIKRQWLLYDRHHSFTKRLLFRKKDGGS